MVKVWLGRSPGQDRGQIRQGLEAMGGPRLLFQVQWDGHWGLLNRVNALFKKMVLREEWIVLHVGCGVCLCP